MKKLSITVLLCVLLFLTSCIPQNTEIKHRLVIEGIGIDYDTGNNLYELTVQVLETSGNSAEQGKSSAPVTNYSVKGKTVAEAVGRLSENTGRYPLYSQNRLILIGSSVTDRQIIRSLNFFVREYTSRPDVFVAAASGNASEVLTVDASGEVPAKLIESAIEQCHKNSVSVDTELFDTVNLSLEKTTVFTLPLIEVDDNRIPERKCMKVTGTRACSLQSEQKMMSDSETMALLFITDDIFSGTLSITNEKYNAALEIIKSKTKTKLAIKDGRPHIEYTVSCKADIVESDSDSFSDFHTIDVKKIEKHAEETIKASMTGLLERFLKDEKCDIFRIGTLLGQKYPEIYNKLADDWQNTLPTITFSVTADVEIGRIGQMTIRQ